MGLLGEVGRTTDDVVLAGKNITDVVRLLLALPFAEGDLYVVTYDDGVGGAKASQTEVALG